jgi:hypothetical protein
MRDRSEVDATKSLPLDPIRFKVAGTLNVNANQAAGRYFGSFEVTIEYPGLSWRKCPLSTHCRHRGTFGH